MIPPEFQTVISMSKIYFLLVKDPLKLSRLLSEAGAKLKLWGANNLQMVNFVPVLKT